MATRPLTEMTRNSMTGIEFGCEKFDIDEDLASFHDAELYSILNCRSDRLLELGFRLVNGRERRIIFSGVSLFRAIDFCDQNVVSRLLLSQDNIFSEDDILHWVKWALSFSDAPALLDRSTTETYLKGIFNGKDNLFVLEPSRGAELSAIYESILLR